MPKPKKKENADVNDGGKLLLQESGIMLERLKEAAKAMKQARKALKKQIKKEKKEKKGR